MIKPYQPKLALVASITALAVVTILILIKSYAYSVSNSGAMLGSLMDSIVDAAVSLMLFFAVRLSLKPADETHRHGHGKAEGIASLMQGAFMSGAGLFLLFEMFERLIHPVAITDHKIVLLISGIAMALSLCIVLVQKFVLSRAPSLAIEADHAHYKADILLNGGVILAILIHLFHGPVWIDTGFALCIALYFFFTAYQIVRKSFDMLMDKELSDDVRAHIVSLIQAHNAVHDIHDLRTRQSGMQAHVSFDVELDPSLTLQAAHDIVRELDQIILKHYPHMEVIIHMDPIGDTADPRHHVDGKKL